MLSLFFLRYNFNNPSTNTPAAKASKGFEKCHEDTFPPRLECLDASSLQQALTFMNSLFVISPVLSMFLPGGILRPFLHTCAAAIIAGHEHFTKKFGSTNRLVDKVRITAEKVKLCCGDARGAQVIVLWGKIINADFKKRNQTHFGPKLPRDIGEKLNMALGLIYQMQQSQAEMQKSQAEMQKSQADRQSELLLVQEELRQKRAEFLLANEKLLRMKEELMGLKRGRVVDVQEERVSPSKRGAQQQDPSQERPSPGRRNNVGEEDDAALMQPPVPAAAAALHHGYVAAMPSLKGMDANRLVEEFYEYRKIHRTAPMNDFCPSYVSSGDRAKFKHVTRTLHIIMLEQDFYNETHAFCKPDLAEEELFNISVNLQKNLRQRAIFLQAKKNSSLPEGVVRQDQYNFPTSKVKNRILGLGALLTGTERITWN
jgi:hypothetical protein